MSITELYNIFLKYPSICIDTRKIETNCLFFALKGSSFDANKFAAQALENGAAYAIIDNEDYAKEGNYILVEDTLKTLQGLANFHRQQFDIPVIGITGTNGKTTTKELIYAVLSSHYRTHATKGNFNNHIGVPLTLLAMSSDTEVAIIEMGANHVGEIDFLCQIAHPTHGLITNVGEAHLEGFGSFDGVKQAKGELYRYIATHKGFIFVNLDEAYLSIMASDNEHKVLYKQSEVPSISAAEFETKLVAVDPFVVCAFLEENGILQTIHSQLIGLYNFNNIMTAATLGRYFKVPADKIKAAIENYCPTNNRSQISQKASNKFLLDAYNANPTSMTKALESFATYTHPNKIAILGDMLELGAYSEEAHSKIIDLAKKFNIKLITVGAEFYKNKEKDIQQFADTKALKEWFWQQNFENTFFLLKGSRGIGLEKLLK